MRAAISTGPWFRCVSSLLYAHRVHIQTHTHIHFTSRPTTHTQVHIRPMRHTEFTHTHARTHTHIDAYRLHVTMQNTLKKMFLYGVILWQIFIRFTQKFNSALLFSYQFVILLLSHVYSECICVHHHEHTHTDVSWSLQMHFIAWIWLPVKGLSITAQTPQKISKIFSTSAAFGRLVYSSFSHK